MKLPNFVRPKKSVTDHIAVLAAVRSHREDLLAKRAKVAGRPRAQDDLVRDIDAAIAGMAARQRKNTYVFSGTKGPVRISSSAHNPLDVVALTNPDLLRDMALEQIVADQRPGDPIGDADREEQLAEFDRSIMDIQVAEELEVRLAEESGQNVIRRRDTHPAVILATTAALKSGAILPFLSDGAD